MVQETWRQWVNIRASLQKQLGQPHQAYSLDSEAS